MKPIISCFVFSDDTQHFPNQNAPGAGSLHIVNPVNLIRPPYVPGTFTFAFSFGLLRLDPEKNHTLEVKIFTPSNQEVLNTGPLSLPENSDIEDDFPLEATGAMFNFNFRNVEVPENGEYSTQILINDELVGSYPLYVLAQRRS